jgi:hypothetical protein
MGVETILLLLSGSVAAVALISAVAIRGWMGSHKGMASTAIAVPQAASYYGPSPVAENAAVETSASTQPPETQRITTQETTTSNNEDYNPTTETHAFEQQYVHQQESAPEAQPPIIKVAEEPNPQTEVPPVTEEVPKITYSTASEESAATPTNSNKNNNSNEVAVSKPNRRARSRANGTRRQRKKPVENGS